MTEPIALPRPPAPSPLAEPSAIVEPHLRGMPPPPGAEITDYEIVAGERTTLRSEESYLVRARDAAMQDEKARAVLSGEPVVVLGAAELVDQKSREYTPTVLIAYDYAIARSYEIALDSDGETLRVSDVRESDTQPSPSDAEIERAIGLARGQADQYLERDWTANALLASGVSPGDRYFGRRLLVVVFGPADERLPRVRCLVDLSSGDVLGMDVHAPTGEEEQ